MELGWAKQQVLTRSTASSSTTCQLSERRESLEKVREENKKTVVFFFVFFFYIFYLLLLLLSFYYCHKCQVKPPTHSTKTDPSPTRLIHLLELTAKDCRRAKLVFLPFCFVLFPSFSFFHRLSSSSYFSARFSLVMIKPERVVGRTQRAR